MRTLCLLLLASVACHAILPDLPIPLPLPDIPLPDLKNLNPAKIADLFGQFKKNFGKKYENDEKQKSAMEQFGKNVKKIIELNLKNIGKQVEFGVNQFTDLTNEEFSQKVLMKKPLAPTGMTPHNKTAFAQRRAKFAATPTSFDWRKTANIVSPIKNQGNCGCCWAFTTAGVVTGAYGLRNKKLVEPSEQQICDCAGDPSDAGCDGGYVNNGLDYVMNNGVSVTSGYAAYTPGRSVNTGVCDDSSSPNNIYISDFSQIWPEDATELRDTLYVAGPMGVAFAVGESFRYYKSGVYNYEDCYDEETLDGWHAVTLVGYGSASGQDFWILKNSWGTSFGEQGYFRMARGNDLCYLETNHVFYAIA